jgi:hypothetical protein
VIDENTILMKNQQIALGLGLIQCTDSKPNHLSSIPKAISP